MLAHLFFHGALVQMVVAQQVQYRVRHKISKLAAV